MTDIEIESFRPKDFLTPPFSPVVYSGSKYGIDGKFSGKNVKICIIDSGCPDHKLINTSNVSKIVTSVESLKPDDTVGHATMLAGLLVPNDDKIIKGLVPNATLLYAKATNSHGKCSFNSVLTAVLWAIVQEVNVIVLSMGTPIDYPILHDGISKAYTNGICVVAPAYKNKRSTQPDFPGSYKEVLSVGCIEHLIKSKTKVEAEVYVKGNDLVTTYKQNKYIKASGTSLATAYVAGLIALLIEEQKSKISNPQRTPSFYYDYIKKIAEGKTT